jgi:hypothetical protein
MHAYTPAPSDAYNNEFSTFAVHGAKIWALIFFIEGVCRIMIGRGVNRHFWFMENYSRKFT